jgi:ribokinase
MVTFISRVGNDIFGKQALEQFEREGINTTFIRTDDAYPSGVALINVDAHGENCIAVAPGANAQLSVDTIKHTLSSISKPVIVLIQLEIPLDSVAYAISQAAQKKAMVILNPAPATKLGDEVLQHVNLITPNESEAQLLTGIEVTDETTAGMAANALHSKGIPQVIITLGAKGAYLSHNGNSQLIKSPSVTAVDTTAAGDCFNGALAVAMSENKSLEESVAFACRAAALSVTRMGAQASMPFRGEVGN